MRLIERLLPIQLSTPRQFLAECSLSQTPSGLWRSRRGLLSMLVQRNSAGEAGEGKEGARASE